MIHIYRPPKDKQYLSINKNDTFKKNLPGLLLIAELAFVATWMDNPGYFSRFLILNKGVYLSIKSTVVKH